jgi:hypothetical protein
MSTEDEDERIRKDHAKGMGYRQLARKYRKSFSQLKKILKNPTSLAERIEALENRLTVSESREDFDDGVFAWVIHQEDFVPWCINHDIPMENEGNGYKCLNGDKEWP